MAGEREPQANKMLWITVSTLATLVVLLFGFAYSQFEARVNHLETMATDQAKLNSEREARLTRLETTIPEIRQSLVEIRDLVRDHIQAVPARTK